MSASIAGTGVRRLVHYSTRELVAWGVIPKGGPSNILLSTVQHKTAIRTGKPKGIWYAYEDAWASHVKTSSKNTNASTLQYKYIFELPESIFTLSIEPNLNKILILTPANFQEFLTRYNAPGVRSKKKEWIDFWEGYIYNEGKPDAKHVRGVKDNFAGIEFSQELVEYKDDIFKNDRGKLTTEFDFTDRNRTVKHAVVDVSFLRFLEIRSGCIFHPERLFPHPPSHYLVSTSAAAGAAAGAATGTARRRRNGGNRTRFTRRRSRI